MDARLWMHEVIAVTENAGCRAFWRLPWNCSVECFPVDKMHLSVDGRSGSLRATILSELPPGSNIRSNKHRRGEKLNNAPFGP
jgi:hypothetical protein